MNNNELVSKVLEYIPNEQIEIVKNIDGNTVIIFETHNSLMTILPSNTWLEIKRIIDSKINYIKPDECNICCSNKLIHIRRISCNRCSENWCIGCYTKIMVVNKGLIVCPYCKFTFGRVVPPHILKNAVEEILGGFRNKIQKKIKDYL